MSPSLCLSLSLASSTCSSSLWLSLSLSLWLWITDRSAYPCRCGCAHTVPVQSTDSCRTSDEATHALLCALLSSLSLFLPLSLRSFVESLPARGPEAFFWFDCFALDQHAQSSQGAEWWRTTFKRAIGDIGHTVMMMAPWDSPIPVREHRARLRRRDLGVPIFRFFYTTCTCRSTHVDLARSRSPSIRHSTSRILFEYTRSTIQIIDVASYMYRAAWPCRPAGGNICAAQHRCEDSGIAAAAHRQLSSKEHGSKCRCEQRQHRSGGT